MKRLDVATSKQTATVPSPASSTKARSHNPVFRWLTSFWHGLFGSKSPPNHQSQDDKSPVLLQAFILEPMYTPSGLVDGIDETPDLATMDIDTPELPELGEEWDISDGDSQTFSNADGDVDVTPEDTADSSAETTPETPLLTDQLENIPFINPTFESGTFTVGETGEVSIDFLFDGGSYQGELAIFSLDGMDEFEPGSEEFIQEAASRALSDSELGHIVISDQTEGARFVGELGESDRNSGDYLGVKTVQMRPGDEFGFMLVPNNTVQRVFDNPDAGGTIRPLFSMATANPEDAFHTGQIADVTGDGSTFVMEDLRVDADWNDQDYNDIVFQVRGATGNAALMDDVVDPNHDWRGTDMGEALIEYARPYITPDTPDDGGLLTDDSSIDEGEIVTEPTTDESTDVVIDEPVNNSEIVTEPTTDSEPIEYDFSQKNQPLVGIIDTGFSDNNPDIDYSRISLGQDRIDGDDNPLLTTDEGNEHGTHVLGTIGATQDNDIGVEGINDDAPIWVGRAVGSGKWAESLVEFVDAAQESGQPNAVVNLSMDLTQIDADGNVTTRYEFTPQERSAIEYARQNNVMLVVAAGNDGGVMSALGQASQEFDNIITVGAAEQFDPNTSVWQGFERSNYSSYGNGLDIMANGGTIDNPTLSLTDEGVGTMAGTSVATANVTGAASQIWAANPELSYRQVIDILKDTATDLGTPNWNSETGTGLLNMAAAVNLAKATTLEAYNPEAFLTPTTWSGEGKVTPTERAVLTAEQIGKQPTGGSYASGYIAPFKGGATLTQDWNSNYSHNGGSAYAKDWVIADRKVYAAKSGTVKYIKQDSTRYGNSSAYKDDANFVIISHDDGYESLYVHLQAGSVPVNVGDPVQAGDYIGMTGLSGWTTGEHLHFAVRNPSTKYSVPFKLDGSDTNDQNPSTPPPDSSGIFTSNFSAWVMATAGANVRSGPGTNYSIVGGFPYQTDLEFDAWTYGETITDIQLGTPDARWYRIKGTNNWIASAILFGNPPDSTPMPSSNPDSSNDITTESFSGSVGPEIGVNLRNSPAHEDRGSLNEPYGKTLYFDAWTYGEIVRDLWTNEQDALWYRVAGTNYWVPSAYIYGYPDSRPPLLPQSNPNPSSSTTINGHTISGNFYSVWQEYQGTLKNPTTEAINYSDSISYQLFENGSIVSSSHGTFPLYGGIRKTYLNNGGLNGWLGVPTSAEVGQGNGVIKQTFDNGYIIWNGSKATAYKYGSETPNPSKPPNNPSPNDSNFQPILAKKDVNYFKERSQFYTTGNIFHQSGWGSNLLGGGWNQYNNGGQGTEGNCTWYAHGRVKELGGDANALNSMNGNANEWHTQLSNGAYIVSDPQPGDIAQWDSNHVAVVERINNDGTITISESHWKTTSDGGKGTLHNVKTIQASNPNRYIRVPGVNK